MFPPHTFYTSVAGILNASLSFILSIFHLWEVKWIGIHLHSNLMMCKCVFVINFLRWRCATVCKILGHRRSCHFHSCFFCQCLHRRFYFSTLSIQLCDQPSMPMNRSPTNKPICILQWFYATKRMNCTSIVMLSKPFVIAFKFIWTTIVAPDSVDN